MIQSSGLDTSIFLWIYDTVWWSPLDCTLQYLYEYIWHSPPGVQWSPVNCSVYLLTLVHLSSVWWSPVESGQSAGVQLDYVGERKVLTTQIKRQWRSVSFWMLLSERMWHVTWLGSQWAIESGEGLEHSHRHIAKTATTWGWWRCSIMAGAMAMVRQDWALLAMMWQVHISWYVVVAGLSCYQRWPGLPPSELLWGRKRLDITWDIAVKTATVGNVQYNGGGCSKIVEVLDNYRRLWVVVVRELLI